MLDHQTGRQARRPLFLSPEAELRRLDTHFRRVLARLQREPPPGLGRAQRRARGRHVEELERYRRGRTFPKNHAFPGLMVPIFVDAAGTRCAMGHLIEKAGGADLVHHVASARNFAYLPDLANIPELLAWLEANGLTVAEAALIQPSYCEAPQQCVCKYDGGLSTVMEGNVQADPAGTILVTATYGADAGVAVGDVLPHGVDETLNLMPGDHVLASYNTSGDMPTASIFQVLDASGLAIIAKCTWSAGIPGPLPVDVLVEARMAADYHACSVVLGAYDDGWTQFSGSGCPSNTTSSGSGSSMGSGGSGGSASGSGSGGSRETDAAGGCGVHPGDSHGAGLALALLVSLCAARGLRRRR